MRFSSPVLSLSYYPASADILSCPVRLANLQDGDERMIQMQKGEHESLHFLLLHTVQGRKREDAPGAPIDSGDLIGFISQDVGPLEEAPRGRRSPPPPTTPIPTLLKEKACVIVFPPSSVSLSDGSCGIISNPRSLNNSSRAIYTQMESPLKSPPVSLSDA